MLEQSRRDQQRREESRRVTQQSHRQPKPSQSSHHSQQQEDEWRPAYSSQSAASQLATEYSHYGKASGERSNQTAPSTNFRHDRDYSANGYGYTPDQVTTNPPHTKSHYQPPLPGHNSPLLPAGQSNIYGVSGSRGTAEPHEVRGGANLSYPFSLNATSSVILMFIDYIIGFSGRERSDSYRVIRKAAASRSCCLTHPPRLL